jgi:hypothetical protein
MSAIKINVHLFLIESKKYMDEPSLPTGETALVTGQGGQSKTECAVIVKFCPLVAFNRGRGHAAALSRRQHPIDQRPAVHLNGELLARKPFMPNG